MLRVIGCVTDQHDLRLVLLAVLICAISSGAAMALVGRASERQGQERVVWTIGASTLGACGIWSTHFIAMLGFHPGMPLSYDGPNTMLSIIAAILLTGGSYWVAINVSAIFGGALAGLAIACMHFIGMAGLHVQAQPSWDPVLVIVAVVIGVVFGASALAMAVKGRRLRDWAAAALLLMVAICGLHFTALAAVVLTPDPTIVDSSVSTPPFFIALAVSMISMIIIAGAVTCYIVIRLRAYIATLELTQLELRRTAGNLEEALAAAARASQAKSHFLATMSHELRTPLNAVIGFSELLSEETFGPLTPVYKDYAMTIRDSGRHLLGIINDVLDVSKLDADKLELREEIVSVDSVIEGCLRIMAQPASVGRVMLESDLEEHLPGLWADEQRIRQVIFNLVSNAVKFTLPGGTVRIAAFSRDKSLTIRIADNGVGMRAEDIPTALERFGQVDNTLSRRTEGTGLGLPLSKRLVELHEATFVLDSALGVGTSITLTFPPERVIAVETPAQAVEELPLLAELGSAAAA